MLTSFTDLFFPAVDSKISYNFSSSPVMDGLSDDVPLGRDK